LVALAAIATVGTMIVPATAEAGPQTESAVVADSATQALTALERWHRTRQPADYSEFRANRTLAATVIATDLGVSADALLDEWEQSDERKQVAMFSAFTQLGVPYRSMASKPGVGFDCSGLTTWAFAQAGLQLPRISGDQIRASDQLDLAQAQPGDLTYYPGHVSIYIGQGLMVHSPNSGHRVEVRPLPDRSNRFGDAFTDELVAASGLSTQDTHEVVDASGRLWYRYWD
jgi:cell wall-associated NlpC family hydrolase